MFPSNALSQPTPKKLPKKLLSNLTKYLNELAFKIVEIVQSLYNFSTKGDRSIVDRIINDLSLDDPDTILMLQTNSIITRLVQSIKREDILFIQFSEKGLISKRSQLVNLIGSNRENLKSTSDKNTDVIKRTFKDLGVPLSNTVAVKRVSESLKQYFDSKAPFDFASEFELNNSFSSTYSTRASSFSLVLKSPQRTLRKRTVNATKVTSSSSSSSSNPSARKRNRLVKLKVLPPPYPPITDEAMPSPLKDTTRHIFFAAAGNNNMIIGGGGDVNKR